jgi:hypothetical protein
MNGFPLPWRERVRVRGESFHHHPHLNPPPSRGRKSFRELDAPQLAAGQFTGIFVLKGLPVPGEFQEEAQTS